MPDLPPREALGALRDRLQSVVLGQPNLIRGLLVGLLANGHVLIEGMPGTAKTRAVRALTRSLGLPFRRVQFTPDLLPADLLGTTVFQPSGGEWTLRPGPIVTSVLLADEINRAPAKVQSALLEAMQERQITIAEHTIPLPRPFWVLATQNPIEHEGTYPLPEAQLDRFLLKIRSDYPDRAAEIAMLDLPDAADASRLDDLEPILDPAGALALQAAAEGVHVAASLKAHIVDLARATRDPKFDDPWFEHGASPRAALDLMRAARAHALLEDRDYVAPRDLDAIRDDVLRHRLPLSWNAESAGATVESLLARLRDRVPPP